MSRLSTGPGGAVVVFSFGERPGRRGYRELGLDLQTMSGVDRWRERVERHRGRAFRREDRVSPDPVGDGDVFCSGPARLVVWPASVRWLFTLGGMSKHLPLPGWLRA